MEIGSKDFDLEHFEEVHTSRRWLVRVYKVLDNEAEEDNSATSPGRTGAAISDELRQRAWEAGACAEPVCTAAELLEFAGEFAKGL